MHRSDRRRGLKTIFSIFLGLMLAVFVGLGVYTFYPQPEYPGDEIQELRGQEADLRDGRSTEELDEGVRQEIEELRAEREERQDAAEQARKTWTLATSIILIIVSTLALTASLLRAEQLPVISDGLLLGGLFTMLYGVGWIVAGTQSVTRFLVMTVALAITLGLGYVRFVRRSGHEPAVSPAASTGGAELAVLERRVHELERRLDGAADFLKRSNNPEDEHHD